MEPISLVCGVIATAETGFCLSKKLIQLSKDIRNAPTEIAAIGRNMSSLSARLRELQSTLKSGGAVIRNSHISLVNSRVESIKEVYCKVKKLINITQESASQGAAWAATKGRTIELLKEIKAEEQEIGSLKLDIMLAMQVFTANRRVFKTFAINPVQPRHDLRMLTPIAGS